MDNSGVGMMEVRPPYIAFERRAVEHRGLAEVGGGINYVDKDFALVTAQGSRDTTEKLIDEWFPYLRDQVRQGRFPAKWLDAYQESYKAWKNDQEPPLHGTSVKNWPAASAAEVKILVAARVLTIEDLALANEEMLERIGMGARSLKQRAIDWTTGKTGQGALVAQLDALRQVIAGLEVRLANAEARAAAAETRTSTVQVVPSAPAGMEPLDDRLARARQKDTGPSDDALIGDALNEVLEG